MNMTQKLKKDNNFQERITRIVGNYRTYPKGRMLCFKDKLQDE